LWGLVGKLIIPQDEAIDKSLSHPSLVEFCNTLDAQSGQITALALREGHLFKKDVQIALAQIERIGEAAIHLNIAKADAK
jgi:hypothetical protein